VCGHARAPTHPSEPPTARDFRDAPRESRPLSLSLARARARSPSLILSPVRLLPPAAAEVTPFGYFATEACYGEDESEAWRQRLVSYLHANRDFAVDALTAALAGRVRVSVSEASYLLWVDTVGALPEGGGSSAAAHLLAHGVGVSAGEDFGGPESSFRLNFACSREILEKGLRRIIEALKAR
jgi:bifunctional pyridoxal-dependent enzyme with beta-cystathionase and maltose regulon repressor activities